MQRVGRGQDDAVRPVLRQQGLDEWLQNSLRESAWGTYKVQEMVEEAKHMNVLDSVGMIADAVIGGNSKVSKAAKALAIAQTIWTTGQAVMKAMAEVPWPMNIGVAAGVTIGSGSPASCAASVLARSGTMCGWGGCGGCGSGGCCCTTACTAGCTAG